MTPGGCVTLCICVQFEEQSILDMSGQLDHRQWTQQHLDAADLRLNSMAPTPPQGEIENDCMDVNVRGPGERLHLYHHLLLWSFL